MGKVVDLPVVTRLNLPPERILDRAKEAGLTGVVVLGWDENAQEYVASSLADGAEMLWLLRRAEHLLMKEAEQ